MKIAADIRWMIIVSSKSRLQRLKFIKKPAHNRTNSFTMQVFIKYLADVQIQITGKPLLKHGTSVALSFTMSMNVNFEGEIFLYEMEINK